MEWMALACRLFVAVVFLVAAAAKVADPRGTRDAVRAFGVPAVLAAPVALALPCIEFGIAAATLPATSALWASIGAIAVLAVFTAAIGLNLLRGRRPDCHCFGSIGEGPIGGRTLLRNAGLLAVAAAAVPLDLAATRTVSAVAWIGDLSTAEGAALGIAVAAAAMVAVLGWIVLQLIAQNGRLLVRIEAIEATADGGPTVGTAAAGAPGAGLAIGTTAPGFALPGIRGESITLDSLRAAGRPVLLAFTDPGCGPCSALLPDFARWQRDAAGEVTIALLSRRSAEENRAKAGAHNLAHILLQQDREVMKAYRAEATPSMVLVNPDGAVGSALAVGAEQIRALVARVVGGSVPLVQAANGESPCPNCGRRHDAPAPPATALGVGSQAPSLSFPDLKGNQTALATASGRETLVVFWNPACGFCQQMLADIKAIDERPPAAAPALVFVSTGTRQANETQGFRAPVLIDQSFEAGRAFGAQGTPSAVLLDAAGRVASPVVVGAPAVLAIARGERNV